MKRILAYVLGGVLIAALLVGLAGGVIGYCNAGMGEIGMGTGWVMAELVATCFIVWAAPIYVPVGAIVGLIISLWVHNQCEDKKGRSFFSG